MSSPPPPAGGGDDLLLGTRITTKSLMEDSSSSLGDVAGMGLSSARPQQGGASSSSPPTSRGTPPTAMMPTRSFSGSSNNIAAAGSAAPAPAATAPARTRSNNSLAGFWNNLTRSRSTRSNLSTNSGHHNASMSSMNYNNPRAILLANRLNWRTTTQTSRRSNDSSGGGEYDLSASFGSHGRGGSGGGGFGSGGSAFGGGSFSHHHNRRYNAGESVLVHIHHHPHQHHHHGLVGHLNHHHHHHHHVANPVNRFGFPAGEGNTADEQRGPYHYVLARVKQIHFEEIALYYTVTRCDTQTDQRADTAHMVPIRPGTRGELAAMRAAAARSRALQPDDSDRDVGMAGSGGVLGAGGTCLQSACFYCLLPFLCLYDIMVYVTLQYIAPAARGLLEYLQLRAYLILNGREPFVCRLRVTFVNLMVLCSTWYMFSDQLRLAFFPASADNELAAVNLAVWIILVLELVFEIFIRPGGYKNLIISDKAYAPTTVRFINSFHVCVESISLLFFVPEFYCIWKSESCSKRYPLSFHNAVMFSVIGPSRLEAFYGHLFLAVIRLRVFGLVRHWRNMWITNAFINMKYRAKRGGFFSIFIPSLGSRNSHDRKSLLKKSNIDAEAREEKIKELTLTNASNIGTALMVTNSYRAMVILWTILGVFPLILTLSSTTTNSSTKELTAQLQAINLVASDTKNETCDYLGESVLAWVKTVAYTNYEEMEFENPYLLNLVIEPARCNFDNNTLISNIVCQSFSLPELNASFAEEDLSEWEELCINWVENGGANVTAEEVAERQGSRVGSLMSFNETDRSLLYNGAVFEEMDFTVMSRFDFTEMLQQASRSSVLLQFCMLLSVLGGLSVLRRDAELLVLGPLRRMLKIVARYAKNPLMPPTMDRRAEKFDSRDSRKRSMSTINSRDDTSISDRSDQLDGGDGAALGSYETETLITAVARITDLLRKCWGVAGADIISTNLATREGALTEVFNPTVPGKSVYALFAFAAINGFDHALRNLGGDVMVLINDVANVLHGEVFRWGFGDSGQCNKNLGGAFLMVFRIGLVEEVIEKLEQATDVVFSTKSSQTTRRRGRSNTQSSVNTAVTSTKSSSHERSSSSLSYHGGRNSSAVSSKRKNQDRRESSVKAMSLSLQSLPGISTFTDRAVIGMLKSFAGIYRDQKILKWNNDFRLGAGVGAFRASLIFGMDAGWAVEGAVGSEYKIDATYLSPHVNMASRMMSACKQYGVSIMLSQAVQELMSNDACSKLRHLDTVTVKGSSVKQRIYTYDCKAKGVDFFLYGRSDDQADIDADRYSPNIWNQDQDLKSMRQHVTDDFLKQFRSGHKAYLSGDWPTAIKMLEKANNTMFETAVEEGYLEDEFDALQIYAGQDFTKAADDLKRENGDGPSIYLINYMKSLGGKAPERWEGWHPLTRK